MCLSQLERWTGICRFLGWVGLGSVLAVAAGSWVYVQCNAPPDRLFLRDERGASPVSRPVDGRGRRLSSVYEVGISMTGGGGNIVVGPNESTLGGRLVTLFRAEDGRATYRYVGLSDAPGFIAHEFALEQE